MRTSRNSRVDSARRRPARAALRGRRRRLDRARPRARRSSIRTRSSSAGRSSSTASSAEPRRHAARTPARNFGSVITTVVPARRRLDLEARSPRRTSTAAARARCRARSRAPRPASAAARALGSIPVAVVGHAQLDVGAEVDALDLDRAALGAGLDAVAHGVLDQRLQRQHGHDRLQHLRVDLHAHAQPLAEARLLEPQVLLDVAQLVGERDVRPLAGERVADELGELGQQLARLLRPRVDEGRRPQRARCR